MRLAAFVAGLGAVVALAACGNSYGPGGSGCSSTTTKVCAVDNVFEPTKLTITAGTTVTWQNGGSATHSVTSDTGEPFNTDLASGQSTTHRFDTPGTYGYHCRFHGTASSGMHATITVNP